MGENYAPLCHHALCCIDLAAVMHIYIHNYIYIHNIYFCSFACISLYVCMYIYIYIHMCIHISVHMYIYILIYVDVYMYVYVHIYRFCCIDSQPCQCKMHLLIVSDFAMRLHSSKSGWSICSGSLIRLKQDFSNAHGVAKSFWIGWSLVA